MTIVLQAGRYELQESFRLGPEDSGRPGAPITYRAAPNSRVIITGSREVPQIAVTSVADQSIAARLDPSVAHRVRQIDLRSLDVSYSPGRQPEVTGAHSPTEVFLLQGGVRGHEARYPDKGQQLRIASVHADDPIPIWRIDDREPFTWGDVSDLWVEGFPGFDWGYQVQKVIRIDAEHSTISLGTPSEFGSTAGQPFHFTNVLEDLNQVEEYYIDQATEVLYFMPTGEDLHLSTLSEPLISGSGVSHVRFEGFEFNATRGDGIRIDGGTDIRLRGNFFTNIGLTAVRLNGTLESSVIDNEIHEVGAGGISLVGGDRRTLSAGRNKAANNHISKFAETYPRYSPAVSLEGVGNYAVNNEIHTAPHLAVQVRGNDHIIDSNYIHDVVLDASDSGAIYGGRDWTERGNRITNNYLERIGGGSHDVAAIYLDDMMSGTLVRGNIVADSAVGVQHNGRDNQVVSNIFVRNERAIYIGDWARDIAGTNGELARRLQAVPYRSRAWRKYPNLARILEDQPSAQKYNVVASNALIGEGRISVEEAAPTAVTLRHNRTLRANSVVTGATLGDLHIPAHSPVRRVPGLQLPDVSNIGRHGSGPSQPTSGNEHGRWRFGLFVVIASVTLSIAGAMAWRAAGRRPR